MCAGGERYRLRETDSVTALIVRRDEAARGDSETTCGFDDVGWGGCWNVCAVGVAEFERVALGLRLRTLRDEDLRSGASAAVPSSVTRLIVLRSLGAGMGCVEDLRERGCRTLGLLGASESDAPEVMDAPECAVGLLSSRFMSRCRPASRSMLTMETLRDAGSFAKREGATRRLLVEREWESACGEPRV